MDKARLYSRATFFSWIVAALCAITKVILWLLIFLLLKNLILGDGVTMFVETLDGCIKQSESSCYKRMIDAFFPDDMSFAWVTFRMKNPNHSQSFMAIEFAVHLNNPVFLFVATMDTAITCWFLGYINTFLRDTANIAAEPAPNP